MSFFISLRKISGQGLKFIQTIFALFPIHYTLNDPTIWLSFIPYTKPYYFIDLDQRSQTPKLAEPPQKKNLNLRRPQVICSNLYLSFFTSLISLKTNSSFQTQPQACHQYIQPFFTVPFIFSERIRQFRDPLIKTCFPFYREQSQKLHD